MAHEKDHDYHILNPSIYPLLGAVFGFIMLFGAVLFFHDNGPWVLIAGFLGVLYVMYGWWSDTVDENHAGDHTPVVLIGLRYGFILFIMSEIMFFSAWFWSFFKHAMYPMGEMSPLQDGVWPPVGIETFDPWHLPLINTLILLCSGAAATWAHHALVHEENPTRVSPKRKPYPRSATEFGIPNSVIWLRMLTRSPGAGGFSSASSMQRQVS